MRDMGPQSGQNEERCREMLDFKGLICFKPYFSVGLFDFHLGGVHFLVFQP